MPLEAAPFWTDMMGSVTTGLCNAELLEIRMLFRDINDKGDVWLKVD